MAIAFVNTGAGTNDAAGASIATAATALTVGNFLVVHVFCTSAAGVVTSVTDTAGNTYVQVPGAFQRTNNNVTDVWVATTFLGNASNVVTANLSSTPTFRRIITHSYSSDGSGITVQAGTTGHTASGSSVTTGNMVTTGTDTLAAGMTAGAGGSAFTAGSSFTLRGTAATDTRSEDRIGVAPGTYTASMTYGATTELWMSAVAFCETSTLPPTGGATGVVGRSIGIFRAPWLKAQTPPTPVVTATTWFGVSVTSIVVGVTTAGTRKTFGVSTVPIVVAVITTGTRKTFGVSTVPIVVSVTTTGKLKAFSSSTVAIVVHTTTTAVPSSTGVRTLPLPVATQGGLTLIPKTPS